MKEMYFRLLLVMTMVMMTSIGIHEYVVRGYEQDMIQMKTRADDTVAGLVMENRRLEEAYDAEVRSNGSVWVPIERFVGQSDLEGLQEREFECLDQDLMSEDVDFLNINELVGFGGDDTWLTYCVSDNEVLGIRDGGVEGIMMTLVGLSGDQAEILQEVPLVLQEKSSFDMDIEVMGWMTQEVWMQSENVDQTAMIPFRVVLSGRSNGMRPEDMKQDYELMWNVEKNQVEVVEYCDLEQCRHLEESGSNL